MTGLFKITGAFKIFQLRKFSYSKYSSPANLTSQYVRDWEHFLKQPKEITAMRTEEVNKEIEELEKAVKVNWEGQELQTKEGQDVPSPIFSFKNMDLHWILKRNIIKSRYYMPTPIQSHTIPIVLGTRDLTASAETGSGKTAAFLLPILSKTLKIGPSKRDERTKPTTLILTPTRELSLQIKSECSNYSRGTPIISHIAIGGVPIGSQIGNMGRGCDIVIATPGRVDDLFKRGVISFENIRHLVLDEADTMLDMGFEPQIRSILEDSDMKQKGERQMLLFSATFPKAIKQLAKDFLNNPIDIRTGTTSTTSLIKQKLVFIENPREKIDYIKKLIKSFNKDDLALIFVNTKLDVEAVAQQLESAGIPTSPIHGDLNQIQRSKSLDSFKSKVSVCLVATNVAARGLNIPKISWVINLDFPQDFEAYVHRIGRTGRAGQPGNALTFVSSAEKGKASKLISLLKETNQEIPDWLQKMAKESREEEWQFSGKKSQTVTKYSFDRQRESLRKEFGKEFVRKQPPRDRKRDEGRSSMFDE